MPDYPANQQLFRRWDVAQMFGVCRRTVVNWQVAGKLTPVQANRPGRRRGVWCRRGGRRLRITTRGPVVLYHVVELRRLAQLLLRDVPEIGAFFSPMVPLAPLSTPFTTALPARKPKPGETA